MENVQKNHASLSMIPAIFALAYPTMLEQFLQSAVHYLDILMVGQTGTRATAAVGAAGTINWLIQGTLSAVAIGFTALISQSLGAKDEQRARKVSSQSVLMVLFLGVAMMVITVQMSPVITRWMQIAPSIEEEARIYFIIVCSPMVFRCASTIFGAVLRAAGDTLTPMKVELIMKAFNILLNFF